MIFSEFEFKTIARAHIVYIVHWPYITEAQKLNTWLKFVCSFNGAIIHNHKYIAIWTFVAVAQL